MLTVRGKYDGNSVKIIDNITETRPSNVLITFIDEFKQHKDELRNLYTNADGFEFWNNEDEDLYQDFLEQKN